MSDDNIVRLRRPVVAEWNVKMRMVFGKGTEAFEFELPDMAMSPAYVDDMVAAFRVAVLKANAKAPPNG